MCIWTKIKQINLRWGILWIFIALGTVASVGFWWIGNKAVADYRVDTLRQEAEQNTQEHTTMQSNIVSMQQDIAVIKNDTAWIKTYLKSNK